MSQQQKKAVFRAYYLCALLLAALFLSFHASHPVCAGAAKGKGKFAKSSCDTKYFDSLKSRAWLEAQREITQNQNLIFKPDSVLEYTCFDKHLNQMAQSSRTLFSQSNRWGTAPAQTIQQALNPVASSANSYLRNNFNHTLLGGRSGTNYNSSASVSPGAYSCNIMDTVWKEAKCMDFIHQASHDDFFTFAQYETKPDMRTLPTACTKAVNFQNEIDKATGSNLPWNPDPVQTYFYLLNRQASDVCGNTANPRTSKVRTGLVINRAVGSVSQYNEYICFVPSCYYQPSGLNSGRCVQP